MMHFFFAEPIRIRMLRAIVSAVAVSMAMGQASVIDCADGKGVFKLESGSLTPSMPVSGKNETLDIMYDVPLPVTAGTAEYSCVLNGLPVFHDKYDLCTQTVCPIVAGTHHDISETAVPSFTGKLVCTIRWFDLNATPLMCLQTTMKIAAALRGEPIAVLDTIPFFEYM